jgi:predicted enzyme related to lactoylglutathione lyase
MIELRVAIDVDDMEKAIAFYTAGIGLSVGRRFDPTWVELSGGSATIDLLGNPSGSACCPAAPALNRDYQRHWTPVHLDFVVDEIETAVERAILAGAVLEKPIQVFGWGKLALMADPFGHGFCFVQFVGCGYDEIAE